MKHFCSSTLIILMLLSACASQKQAHREMAFHYTLSFEKADENTVSVEFRISGITDDSLLLVLPNWMPGYYQMMNYADDIRNIHAVNGKGESVKLQQQAENKWQLFPETDNCTLRYDLKADKHFVANSLVDTAHAYIVPPNTFMYVAGNKHRPVSVKIKPNIALGWKNTATGLSNDGAEENNFIAADFDVLYDCPILIGELEQLPSFEVQGVPHHFTGIQLGDFDKALFMQKLQKAIESAVNLMGDIPYKEYTFIAIGPGRGGIEHLNNTTFSFDGYGMDTPENMDRYLKFLTHEYFHNYNVKRIRPYELGPFDYDKGNKTNLLWLSEGFTVYYEYIILHRAGLLSEEQFLQCYSTVITDYENDRGKNYQTLKQAAYNAWSDGPFGNMNGGEDRSISIYEKGAVFALLLDFEIRAETGAGKSLDDVMRALYEKYYREAERGFTDAEFQAVCEEIAGKSLVDLFDYVYTTEPINYNKYLNVAGLELEIYPVSKAINRYKIVKKAADKLSEAEKTVLSVWLD